MQYTDEAIRIRKSRKNRTQKFITIAIYILLIPLLIYNLSLIFQSIINPNETPNFLGIKTYVIISGSMLPELNIGDIVVVKNIEENELQNGDIISFREGQSIVTHRIIEIENSSDNQKYFKTKGDNNNSADDNTINIDVIEGKVITSIPFIGNIVLLLQGKITIILILIIFYAYFVRSEKIKKRKENRRIKRLEYEKGRMNDEK